MICCEIDIFNHMEKKKDSVEEVAVVTKTVKKRLPRKKKKMGNSGGKSG